MKIKTKLLSVLGATAIATSGAALISSCSYKQSKQKYVIPTVRHNGWTEVSTEAGVPECTFGGFSMDRNLLTGERIVPTITLVSGEQILGNEVIWESDSTFSIKVKLDIAETESQPKTSVFTISFKSMYQGKTYDVVYTPENFTAMFIPKWEHNSAEWSGTKNIDFSTKRGLRVLQVPNAITLSKELTSDDQVLIKTSNAFISATVDPIASTTTSLAVNFEIVDYVYYDEFSVDFQIQITITHNQNVDFHKAETGFHVHFVPNWETNHVTFVGLNSQFTKERSDEIETETFSTGAVFRLDRALKESNEEILDIKVLDLANKEHESIKCLGYTIENNRYVNLNLQYTPEEDNYEDQYPEFYLSFRFFDKIGGDEPIYQEDVFAGKNKKLFAFHYVAPWEKNKVAWVGAESAKTLTPEVGIPSAILGSLDSNGTLQLARNKKLDIENINIELTGADSQLSFEYEIVQGEDKNYYIVMNITCLDVSKTHDVNFGFHFTFTENDNVMYEQDINGFVFKFEKKADLTLSIADTATAKAGDKTLNVVGQLAEALPGDTEIDSAAVTDGEEKDSVTITGTPTLDSTRKVVTFPVALTVADLYTGKTFTSLKITLYLTGGAQARVSNAFNIIFRAAENPITEQSEEDFTNDRSFALEAYTVDSSKKASSTINATAWILSRDLTVKDSNPYVYYMVTSWRFKERYEAMRTAIKSGETFKVGLSDKSMAKSYNTTSGWVTGSKWDTDYVMLDKPTDDLKWQKTNDYYLRYTVPVFMGSDRHTGANMYVAKVNLQNLANANDSIKNKLDRVNAWQEKSTLSGGKSSHLVDKAIKGDASDFQKWGSRFYNASYWDREYTIGSATKQNIATWTVFTGDTPSVQDNSPFEYWDADDEYDDLRLMYNWGWGNRWIDDNGSIWHASTSYYAEINSYYWSSKYVYMSEGGMMIIRKNADKLLYIVSVFAGTEEGALGYHPMFDSFVDINGNNNVLKDFQEQQ